MAIITIKKSQDTDAPTGLANGELAYSYSSDKLFIGQTDTSDSEVTVEYIGGKLLVDKVANLEDIVLNGASTADFEISNELKLSYIDENNVLITTTDGAVTGATGSSGQVFQIATDGTPGFDDVDGGTF